MKKQNIIISIAIFTLLISACKNNIRKEPDCVGSINFNNSYNLQIVANRFYIEDKVAFAWELFEMCKENNFHSTLFSYDLNGYPETLKMDIYLWENRRKTAMEVEFRPEDAGEHDIRDGREEYVLYIDGECSE